jgi:hypothetical protein
VPIEAPSAWPTETPWVVTPTETPSPVPTADPAAARLLPAPLYFIDAKGGISRIEVDGKTITPVTNEAGAVLRFAISPADGSLAYLVQDNDTIRLIHSDGHGQGRSELQTGMMASTIAYSGESVEVAMLDSMPPMQMIPAARTPGVWSFPIGGGIPKQILAFTPPTQAAAGNTKPADLYMPLAWSLDGQKLLLRTWAYNVDDPIGGLALFEKSSGTVRQLLPVESDPACISPSWDGQSVMVYCSTAAPLNDTTPALWRLNIVSGQHETLVPSRDGEKTNLVVNVRELSDGLYSMVATSESNEPLSYVKKYTFQRTALDAVSEREQLAAGPLALVYFSALWAEDGRGIVISSAKPDDSVDLTWYPLRGGEPVVLQSGLLSTDLAWGKP